MVDLWRKIFGNPIVLWGGLVLTIVVWLLVLIGIPILIRKIPADFFTNPKYLDRRDDKSKRRTIGWWVCYIGRQISGILLIIIGTIGLQGVLVVILGLVVMDIKQKASMIQWLVCIGFVWRILAKIRKESGLVELEKPCVPYWEKRARTSDSE